MKWKVGMANRCADMEVRHSDLKIFTKALRCYVEAEISR